MLKLHGEGDPTKTGEGLSFVKTSMKEVFLRAGETLDDRMCTLFINTIMQYRQTS